MELIEDCYYITRDVTEAWHPLTLWLALCVAWSACVAADRFLGGLPANHDTKEHDDDGQP